MEIDMSNYVEQMWNSQSDGFRDTSKLARISAWIVGVLAVVGIAAYATQDYWYPTISPYLYR
jgi:hypothetical protein